jgi:hypothetical protein
MGYHEIESRHPELKELNTFSAEWYRQWRESHLKMFPWSDQQTRDNLDSFVLEAEKREEKKKGVKINKDGELEIMED